MSKPLFKMVESFGKYRFGLVVGSKTLNNGAVPEGDPSCEDGPRSICSQAYLMGSPSASEAVAFNSNGVLIGI